MIYSTFSAKQLLLDSLAFDSTFPPYLCKSFHSVQFVKDESELLLSLINVVLSFNPDFIVEYEVRKSTEENDLQMQRDSIGYLIDRCEYLGIPVLFLLSRCPFSLIHQDIYQNSNLFRSFYIDSECNEYRYDGKANFEQWGLQTNGVMNVNPANTTYNQQKSSTISMNGRYGF